MSNPELFHQNSSPKKSTEKIQKNPSLNKIKKQTLFVRKLNYIDKNMSKSRDQITKEIDNFFFLPDIYFSSNSPVTIGRKTIINDMDMSFDKKLGRRTSIRTLPNKSNKNINKSINITKSPKNYIGNLNTVKSENAVNNVLDNPNYEIIDNSRLSNIFKSFEEKKEKNDFKNNSFSDNKNENNNNLPTDISSSLIDQQKKLNFNKSVDKKFKIFSKYLSKRINKNEKDLLLNQIDSYLYKSEALKNAEKNKPENFNNWSISLRRPDNFQGVRKSYINISTDKHPVWGIVIEKSPKQKEMAIKADSELNNNFKNYINNYKDLKVGGNLRYLKKLDTLSVKGKNLLKFEYNREMSSNGKKILHKVFMDNGKLIFKNEVNNLFGHETFYKNYEKPHCYRSTLSDTNQSYGLKLSNTEREEDNKYNLYRE